MEKVSHNFGSKLSGKGLKEGYTITSFTISNVHKPFFNRSTTCPILDFSCEKLHTKFLKQSTSESHTNIQMIRIPNGFVTIANVFQNALNMLSFPFLHPVTTCLVSSVQWISVRLLKKANLSSWLHNAIPLATSTNAFNVLEYLLQDHLYLPYQLPTIGLSARITQGLLCVITL